MRWRREPHSERSSPGSAAFDLECERENLTPNVRTRRGASDHAGARSRVSIPARASIPKAARAGLQKGRRAAGSQRRARAGGCVRSDIQGSLCLHRWRLTITQGVTANEVHRSLQHTATP